MSIRIESLSAPPASLLFPQPQSQTPVLCCHDLLQDPHSDESSEFAHLYGGTAASVTLPLSPSPPPDPSFQAAASNWSMSLQTMLDRPPSALPNRLVAGGVLFCAAFVTWATVGQMDEIGQARGRLVPQGDTYKIHPVVAGKIANLYAQEGQVVKAGQVMATLDNEMVLNRIEWLRQEHANYEKELLQMDGVVEKSRSEAETRVSIANAEVHAQAAALDQAQAKIESQNASIKQAEMQALTSQVLLSELQTDADAQKERLSRLKYLVEEGALAREQFFQAQQNLGERQRSITQQMGEIQQALAASQRSRSDLQQVIAESQRLRVQFVQKSVEVRDTQLQAQQTIQQLLVQKTQLQAKIQQNDKELQQAKAELNQLYLRAPVDGVVLDLNIRNKGEVVQPGQTIAEVAPKGVPLVLKAALPAREAGFAKVGSSAQIKFDAYPYQDYGIVVGKVVAISPDAKVDDRLGAVYQVDIALDRNPVAATHQPAPMRAGQTATAEIVIRQRRIAEILLDPIRKLQKSDLSL